MEQRTFQGNSGSLSPLSCSKCYTVLVTQRRHRCAEKRGPGPSHQVWQVAKAAEHAALAQGGPAQHTGPQSPAPPERKPPETLLWGGGGHSPGETERSLTRPACDPKPHLLLRTRGVFQGRESSLGPRSQGQPSGKEVPTEQLAIREQPNRKQAQELGHQGSVNRKHTRGPVPRCRNYMAI